MMQMRSERVICKWWQWSNLQEGTCLLEVAWHCKGNLNTFQCHHLGTRYCWRPKLHCISWFFACKCHYQSISSSVTPPVLTSTVSPRHFFSPAPHLWTERYYPKNYYSYGDSSVAKEKQLDNSEELTLVLDVKNTFEVKSYTDLNLSHDSLSLNITQGVKRHF